MKVTILGAGITGLSLGSFLADAGHKVTILDKAETVGGMAKSFKYKNHVLDFGPHKIYSQIPTIIPEFFMIAGEENILKIKKKNSLFLLGKRFDFPAKIPQIVLGISPIKSAKLGAGFMWSNLKNIIFNDKPKTYEEYFIKGFGKPAYNLLFRDLAFKLWGHPRTLSEELARKRVPVPNLLELIFSGKGKDSSGRELSAKYFYYPKKGGIGFISEKYAENIKKKRGKIILGAKIKKIITKRKKITSIIYEKNKKTITQKTDFLAGTIYLKDMLDYITPEVPLEVEDAAYNLKYKGLILVYLIINKKKTLSDNWIFFPEAKYIFNRISEHNSFSPNMVKGDKSIITAEITCDYTSDIYNSHDNYIFRRVIEGLEEANIIKENEVEEFLIKKAGRVYPVYDLNYRKKLSKILMHLDSYDNLITLGRQGLYNYNNTDHCIDMSRKAADYINNIKNKKISDWAEKRRYFDSYRIVD